MSSQPIPIEAERIPFVPSTTPEIELANRLMGLRAHAGFNDLVRIIDGITQEAREKTETYPGWDAQVMVVLKVRQQVAVELKPAIFFRINEAIEAGIAQARAQVEAAQNSVKTAEESIDHGDYVRQEVLKTFAETDMRVPGSF